VSRRIVISEFMDGAAVDALARRFEVDYRPLLVDDAAALEAALPFADAWIVRNRTQVRGRLLDAAGSLKVVGRLGTGVDNIDVATCERRGIAAEHVAAQLAGRRHLVDILSARPGGGEERLGQRLLGDLK